MKQIKTLSTICLILICISQIYCADGEVDQAKVQEIQQTIEDCQTTAKAACQTDCQDGVDILNECLVKKCENIDSYLNLTTCFKQESQNCQLNTVQNQKLYNDLMTCLLYARITSQCQDDEALKCGDDGKCKEQLTQIDGEILSKFYDNCSDQSITADYFSCFSDETATYKSDKDANADAVTQANGRIKCYVNAKRSLDCQTKYYSQCPDKDRQQCEADIYSLSGCLDKWCTDQPDTSGQYVCFIDHFEKCKSDNFDNNQIVKENLRCVHSLLLSTKTAIYILFIMVIAILS